MATLIEEIIEFIKAHMGKDAIALILLCFCGIYIWYQHLRNKLLKEHIDLEKRRGREFLDTALELKEAPTEAIEAGSKPEIDSVLLVDDEKMMLEVISEMLHKNNPKLHVNTAADGVEALQKINLQMPSILVADVVMPNMSGIELLSTLHKKGQLPPTLVISGYDNYEDFQKRLLTKGISSPEKILFLRKPFGLKELLAKLEELGGGGKKSNLEKG